MAEKEVTHLTLHEITNIRGYKVSVYVTYTEQYTDI